MDDNKQRSRPVGDSSSGSEARVHALGPTPLPRSTATGVESVGSVNMPGSQLYVIQGRTVVVVPGSDGDGENIATTNTQRNQDSEDPNELTRTASVRAKHEIYSDQLLTEKRGYPLWIPGPAMQLAVEYRRQGVSIGDIGIIQSSGDFDFLFNIFQPADHPINCGGVPQGFSPLSLQKLEYDIQKTVVYGPDTYLASSSVRKTNIRSWRQGLFYANETSIGQRFESTATEAAILIMPGGATTQDLLNTWLLRQTISQNAREWYKYARYTRGRNVKIGDIRVVVGIDKATSWGIATSTCNTGQTASFVLNRDSTHLYRWDCVGGSGRVGPQKAEIHNLMEDNAVPQNQCVFVRTLNFTVSGKIWDDFSSGAIPQLVSEPDRPNYQDPSSSNPGSGGAADSSGSGNPSSGHPPGSIPGSLHLNQSVKFELVELGANHPSTALHSCLHEKFPDANMVITEDADWISVLNDDDVVFPKPENLCARILKTHELQNDQGIIQLVRKNSPELRPSNSTDLGKAEGMDVCEGVDNVDVPSAISVVGHGEQENPAKKEPVQEGVGKARKGIYNYAPCDSCHRRMIKCDCVQPICSPCQNSGRNLECKWNKNPARQPRKQQVADYLESILDQQDIEKTKFLTFRPSIPDGLISNQPQDEFIVDIEQDGSPESDDLIRPFEGLMMVDNSGRSVFTEPWYLGGSFPKYSRDLEVRFDKYSQDMTNLVDNLGDNRTRAGQVGKRRRLRALDRDANALRVELQNSATTIIELNHQISYLNRRVADMSNMPVDEPESNRRGKPSSSRELRVLVRDVVRENDSLKSQVRDMHGSMEQYPLSTKHAKYDEMELENRKLKKSVSELEALVSQLRTSVKLSSSSDVNYGQFSRPPSAEILTGENQDLESQLQDGKLAFPVFRSSSETKLVDLQQKIEALTQENNRLRLGLYDASEGRREDGSTSTSV